MADEAVFAADPRRIQVGGDATGQVAENTNKAAEQFADATAFDPADPPWGNDSYGNQYVPNYVQYHTPLREGIRMLAQAMQNAGDMTYNAGRNFEKTQSDNTEAIKDSSHFRPHI
ncbi:hypothetical protein [Streptomyces sp. NPDC048521]|uniref:hypothetical protein n=1 Tax=Streptomyces sp. NPDC048521 TaxID=3365566 RepID=UPI0037151819